MWNTFSFTTRWEAGLLLSQVCSGEKYKYSHVCGHPQYNSLEIVQKGSLQYPINYLHTTLKNMEELLSVRGKSL